MGVKEEQTGNVVKAPAIVGEPWWLIKVDGVEICCHVADSWFNAREIGRGLSRSENVWAELIWKGQGT